MAYRDSSVTTGITGTSINATKPATLQPGDVMLAYFLVDDNFAAPPTITAPAGWQLVPGSNQGNASGAPDGFCSFVYWKTAGSNEPATYTFAKSGGSVDLMVVIAAFSGRDRTPTFITHGTVNSVSNPTPVTLTDTGLTALENDDICVFANGDVTVNTSTWSFTASPVSYTERQDSSYGFVRGTVATLDNVSAGATGNLQFTFTRSAGTGNAGWGIFAIAIPKAEPESPGQEFTPIRFKKGVNIKLYRRPSPRPDSFVTGPTVYNDDVTESASALDTQDVVLTTQSEITEPGSATESQDAVKTTQAEITETASAIESQDAVKAQVADISEAGSAAEQSDAIKVQAADITESGSAADATDAVKNQVADISEQGNATEAQNALLTTQGSVTESGAAIDISNAILETNAVILESANATETSDAQKVLSDSITEAATATESQDAIKAQNASQDESASAIEVQDATLLISGSINEQGNADTDQDALLIVSSDIIEQANATDSSDAIVVPAGVELVLESCNAIDICDAIIIPAPTPTTSIGHAGRILIDESVTRLDVDKKRWLQKLHQQDEELLTVLSELFLWQD